MRRAFSFFALAVAALAFTCSFSAAEEMETSAIPAPVQKSLYERLGGEPAITAVVADFVGRAAADPAVNFTRKGTGKEWEATPENVELLKKRLVQFIGLATGGPQTYEGDDMRSAHTGMKITDAEFNAIAGDLKASLDVFSVPAQEQQELLTIVGSTRKDIVELEEAPEPQAPAETTSY